MSNCIMRWAAGISTLLFICTGLAATAQPPVDFSGRWLLESIDGDASTLTAGATELTVHQSAIATTREGAAISPPLVRLEVKRHSGTGVRSEHYMVGMVGGTVGCGIGLEPRGECVQSRYSTTWVGDTVVIESTQYSGRPGENARISASQVEVWSLVAPDALVIAVTETQVGRATQTVRFTYKR